MYITTLTKLEVVSELVVGFVKELGFMTFFYIANLMQIICKVVLRAMLIVGDVPGLWYVKFRPLIMEIMEYY